MTILSAKFKTPNNYHQPSLKHQNFAKRKTAKYNCHCPISMIFVILIYILVIFLKQFLGGLFIKLIEIT